MLRKLLWTAIYSLFAALAAIIARVAAGRVYRIATGEDPPPRR